MKKNHKDIQAFLNAKASLEAEEKSLPEGAENLILSNLRGEISHEEFLKRASEIAKNKKQLKRKCTGCGRTDVPLAQDVYGDWCKDCDDQYKNMDY